MFSFQFNTNHRDLNVKEAWKQGVTGKDVVVSILDDGIEKNHPDLERNYVSLNRKASHTVQFKFEILPNFLQIPHL